jgi:predicted thioesterase
MNTISPGLSGTQSITVTETLTARHIGSGSVDVYGTPAMIALMESAALSAIDQFLAEGQTSVGTKIEVRHLAATPLGHRVRAHAEVSAVDGRKVTFLVQAWDERELIGEGKHVRLVINEADFIKRVQSKVGVISDEK